MHKIEKACVFTERLHCFNSKCLSTPNAENYARQVSIRLKKKIIGLVQKPVEKENVNVEIVEDA